MSLSHPGQQITGTIWSASLNYNVGPIYATAAYEMHKQVDRVAGDFGNAGVADEHAAKIGAGYNFGTNRLAAVFEKLYRNNPAIGTGTEYPADPGNPSFGTTAVTMASAGRNRNGFFISGVQ